jgi:hypothetical protein
MVVRTLVSEPHLDLRGASPGKEEVQKNFLKKGDGNLNKMTAIARKTSSKSF